MPPDFLNSREDALLAWGVLLLGYVVYKGPRGIGGSFLAVLRAPLHPKLLLLFGSALLYSAALVYMAERYGVWHMPALKETIYWFFGTGVILVGEAVSSGGLNIRRVLRRVIAITVLIEFAANLYALPLCVELVVVLVALVFVALQAFAPYDASMTPAVRKFIDGVVGAVGVLYLGYFLARALGNLDGVLSREHAEDLLVGPALTLALIPLLYGVARLSRREQENLRTRLRARLEPGAY